MQNTLEVLVREARHECEEVRSFMLAPMGGAALPGFEAGAHIDVHAGPAGVRQYSLCNGPADAGCYRIAVKREAGGRGGSRWMHDHLRQGDVLRIGWPRNNFRLAPGASRYLLLAGGIGLTPLVSMAEQLWQRGGDFTLCCFARSAGHLAFAERLRASPWAHRVRLHLDALGGPKVDLGELLGTPAPGVQICLCGPAGFMEAAMRAAHAWPQEAICFEHFAPARSAVPAAAARGFEVQLARSGRRLAVPPDRTLLSVLLESGAPVMASCEQGVCGTCVTRYLAGEPEHGDSCLSAAERETQLALCCARSRSPVLVLDL